MNRTCLFVLDKAGPFVPFVDWLDLSAVLGSQEDNAEMALGTQTESPAVATVRTCSSPPGSGVSGTGADLRCHIPHLRPLWRDAAV